MSNKNGKSISVLHYYYLASKTYHAGHFSKVLRLLRSLETD